MRVNMRARAIASLVLGAAAIAVVVSVLPGSGGSGRGGAPLPAGARPRGVGLAGIAAAYGYPSRCLSITIAASDPTYARADFDHSTPCGRYDGYATAIFRRLDGAWRPVLDATGYSCPVGTLPAAVQADLDVCALTVSSVAGRQ